MLTAQRASELHPGWVPFTSSLRLLCALVSHTQQQQFCVLCFQTCALNSALFKFNSASDEQLKFRQKKKKTNPLQGAATMTEYVQVINPHYTTRSTGPISRGYVWGGCGRGGSALRYTQPMRAGGSAHNNREAVRVGTDTAHLQMGMK